MYTSAALFYIIRHLQIIALILANFDRRIYM